ncbi:MAG: Matrixin, partial [Baekduia sp.]|nr:Matrixin [Baekduia sp.]
MDGPHLLPSLRAPARRLLAAGLALLALAGSATAALAYDGATPPATRWPVGGTALRAAMSLGAEHWGASPCRGRISVAWGALGREQNAESSWANDVDPYLQPSRNTDCAITLSTGASWDWAMLCTVVVHEMGHLAGHDHVDDPDDVMYYAYTRPVAECAATPEPVQTTADATTATAPVSAPGRARRATTPAARTPA